MENYFTRLRCMVCQNQSLLESDSDLAIDLKNLIKEMFLEGEKEVDKDSWLEDMENLFYLNPQLI